MKVTKDQVIVAIRACGGELDSWSKIHIFSAIWEAMMLAFLHNINNEHSDLLRTIYLSDIDYGELMKKGECILTKFYDVGLEFIDMKDTNYSFHKIIKIEKRKEI